MMNTSLLEISSPQLSGKETSIWSGLVNNVSRSLADNYDVVETLLRQIIRQCQTIIRAERASLFLVDLRTSQLYSRLFNITREEAEGEEEGGSPPEIRFSLSQGVAGCVARTGKTYNLVEAATSKYFNPAVDQQV